MPLEKNKERDKRIQKYMQDSHIVREVNTIYYGVLIHLSCDTKINTLDG